MSSPAKTEKLKTDHTHARDAEPTRTFDHQPFRIGQFCEAPATDRSGRNEFDDEAISPRATFDHSRKPPASRDSIRFGAVHFLLPRVVVDLQVTRSVSEGDLKSTCSWMSALADAAGYFQNSRKSKMHSPLVRLNGK